MSDTIALDEEQAHFVDALVRSGRFADRRDVVRAGLEALRGQDEAVERWLREDVVPVVAAMMADPSQGIPIDEIVEDIERRHALRVSADSRGP